MPQPTPAGPANQGTGTGAAPEPPGPAPGLPGVGPGLPGPGPGAAIASVLPLKAPNREVFARNWPVFLGPTRARVTKGDYATSWDAEKEQGIAWKTALDMPGKNSPIVWEGRVFLSGADEAERWVYCYDAETGEKLWEQQVSIELSASDEPPEVMDDTGYAAPTMATNGERVFAIFANGDVAAFDMDGKPVWSKALGTPDSMYGYASSLAVHGELVIIQLDQGSDPEDGLSELLALNATDGKKVWSTERPVPNSWSSPIVVNTGERDEILTCADPYVISYDPGTGKELWRTECLGGDVAPVPAFAGGLVFVAMDGAGLFAIRPPKPGEGTEGKIEWSADDGLPDTTSPAVNESFVFLADSFGLLTCYSAKAGEKLWEHDFEKQFTSSPVIAGDLVYITDTEGSTYIFKASETFESVATCKVADDVHATPAFVGGNIYVRGETQLYCVAGSAENIPPSVDGTEQ